jgi:eukaryotic translation initiation factor 2C
MESVPSQNLHQYDVVVSPEVPAAVNRLVFSKFEEKYGRDKLGGIPVAYDGRRIMYSPKALDIPGQDVFEVQLGDEAADPGAPAGARRGTPREFRIKVKKTSELVMEELHKMVAGKQAMTENCLSCIMALNVILSHEPSRDHISRGGSFFVPTNPHKISGGLEIWDGYYQSVRPIAGAIALNMDIANSAFFQGGQLAELIVGFLGARSVNDLRRGIDPQDIARINRFVKGIKVRVSHRGTMRRKYRVSRLTLKPASQCVFTLSEEGKDEKQISVVDYFKDKYNIPLSLPFLPCVLVQRDNFLPIELCSVVEGQRFPAKLSSQAVADMIKVTCRPPSERVNRITDGIKLLKYGGGESAYLGQFGIRINSDMVKFKGRVLDPPTLRYNPKSREAQFKPRDGAWNMRDKQLYEGRPLASWSVVVFAHPKQYPLETIQAFVVEFVKVCVNTGLPVTQTRPPIMHANPMGDIRDIMTKAGKAATQTGQASNRAPQLIMVVLPNTGSVLYSQIKRVCETELGVCTQCVQGKNTFRPKAQYCANVCLKVNAKLGGSNAAVHPRELVLVSHEPTMIVGIDYAQPPPGARGKMLSVATMVGSVNSECTQYVSTIRHQNNGDTITDIGSMMNELLRAFYRIANVKPKRLVIYRDGVSEGQVRKVLVNEVSAIQNSFAKLEAGYKPGLTFVTIQKRHHVRLFPMDRAATDRSGNATAGTVVDTDIVHPSEYDFYLQSHSGLQGTSKPAHYRVIYDENNLPPDKLQMLTYQLCYLFARATRSVSFCTPAYYANLVSARTRCYSGELLSDLESVASTGSGGDSGKEKDKTEYPEVNPNLRHLQYYM